jgi:hypothetical protein
MITSSGQRRLASPPSRHHRFSAPVRTSGGYDRPTF